MYSHHSLSSAWAKLTPAQAHELAMAILYSIGAELPCQGEGVIDKGHHKINLSVSMNFEADMCTVLNKKDDLKKEILAKVSKRLDEIGIPKEELPNV
jgi:hypothetical protein